MVHPLSTDHWNISGFCIIILTVQILMVAVCDTLSSCYVGDEFSTGDLTLSEGDRNRTWLNRQRPLPAGKLIAYSLKSKRVPPSENGDHGIWLLLWRPLQSNQVSLVWQKMIVINKSSETHMQIPLNNDSFEVNEGDLYGWTSHGDAEITLQYLHSNVCYQLVYDESEVNNAVAVDKEEQARSYHTAICYPGVFDLGVFVETADGGCEGFGKIDDNQNKILDDSNKSNVNKAVGAARKTDPDHNILTVNLVVIYFVLMLH